MLVFAYIALKWVAYVSWCRLGLDWLSTQTGRYTLRAGILGTGRLVLGWFAGFTVAPLVATTFSAVSLFYIFGLPLVRWLEWSVMDAVISKGQGNPETHPGMFIAGTSGRARLWRLGGIAVSYAVDAPFLIWAGGFPNGRVFC